jgi:hypothetical protein
MVPKLVATVRTLIALMPLGSFDVLIGMDWLEPHGANVGCHSKNIYCIDDEGNATSVQGILRPISTRQISLYK